MIIPYKYCGLDLAPIKPVVNKNMIVCNKYSYRVYQLPELKILIDGLTFDKKIRAICAQNEFIYVACSNKLYTVKHNVLDMQTYDEKINKILVFHPLKLVATRSRLYVNEQFIQFQEVSGMLHLPTYLNKVIIYSPNFIKIINIVQLTTIVTIYQTQITNTDQQILIVKETPALDIVAVVLRQPYVCVLFNLQTFEKVGVYNLGENTVRDIEFNKEGKVAMMAVSQENQLKLFNLNTQELIYTYTNQSDIDWVHFLADAQLYLGSSKDNKITQFTLNEHKIMNFLRERTGFKDTISTAKFYGLQDEPQINMLATSAKFIRFQSLVNENMTYSKEGDINNFSFSITRENDWANILTSSDKNVQFWNTYQKKLTTRFSEAPAEQILQTLVSSCGNYGFVAHIDKIHRFTMQSGSLALTYKLTNKFIKMFVDPQNQYIIVAQNEIIEQLDFVSGKSMKKQQISSNVQCMVGSKASSILVLALQNNSIIIIDYSTLKKMRTLTGHNLKIFDMALTSNNQHLISVSLDKTLKIWNLIYGNLVQEIQLVKPLISVDVSENQLIGVFMNSRAVNVWHCNMNDLSKVAKAQRSIALTYSSDLTVKPTDFRALIYSNVAQSKIETEQSFYKIQVPQQQDDLISFTTLEDGRWVPIQYIDLIRTRNRVKLADSDIKIPFFMDFRNADQEKKALLDDIKDKLKEKSRVIKGQKDQYLAELQSEFENLVNNENCRVFAIMKTLSPTSYDYELRSSIMGKPQNIRKLYKIFLQLLQTQDELDLKITYFVRFIQISKDDLSLIIDDDLKSTMNKIGQVLELSWSRLEDEKSYVQCVIEYAKSRI